MDKNLESENKFRGVVASINCSWLAEPSGSNIPIRTPITALSSRVKNVDSFKIVLDSSIVNGECQSIPNTTLCEFYLLKSHLYDLLFHVAELEKYFKHNVRADISTQEDSKLPPDFFEKHTIDIRKISAKTIFDTIQKYDIYKEELRNRTLLSSTLVVLVDDIAETKKVLYRHHGVLVTEFDLDTYTGLILSVLLNYKAFKKKRGNIKLIHSNSPYVRFPIIFLSKRIWDPLSPAVEGVNLEDYKRDYRNDIRGLIESTIVAKESQVINSSILCILEKCNELVVNLPKGTDLEPNTRLEMLLNAHEKLAVYHHMQFLTKQWIQRTESRLLGLHSTISDIRDKHQKIYETLNIAEEYLPHYTNDYLEPTLKERLDNAEQIIQSRVEIEKVAVEERRASIEGSKEERYNRISVLLGALVIFEVLANFTAWFFPIISIPGLIAWGVLIIGLYALVIWGLNLLPDHS